MVKDGPNNHRDLLQVGDSQDMEVRVRVKVKVGLSSQDRAQVVHLQAAVKLRSL
ncbi:hypothetical protein PF003_g9580 [Phytophthora fragariae]|nr:hypothetical protein PF003_g9580 [Phytophthora fragariae]